MLKAINDIVIVKRDGYNGKLIVKDQKMSYGSIISVGPGRWMDDINQTVKTGKIKQRFYPTSPDLVEGVHVYFDPQLGKDFEYEGEKYLMIKESHIAAIIDEPEVDIIDKFMQ
jgi:co-chaperonin GroES (HSP10)